MSFKSWLNEATREYVKKVIDPALMTQGEYYNMVNPQDTYHPSSAYNTSLSDDHRQDIKDYPEKIKTIKINGIPFEFRLKKEDKFDHDYIKTNPEGEVVRDENGNALYLTDEEKVQRFGDKRYNYSIGVFTKEDGWVGGSQDEWGAMLIRVVEEYRNFGLGTIIGKLARQYEPDKSSGGFTPSGYQMFKRVHAEYVREYLQSGMYSHLVNTGQISAKRAKEIIDSIAPKSQKRPERNLNTSDPKDWLLYTDEDNFIIYDKKLKDVIGDESNSFWQFKMIKGTILAREGLGYYRIIYFGGETEQIKSYLITLSGMRAKYYNIPLVVEPDDEKYLDKSQFDIIERDTYKPGYKSHLAVYKGQPIDTELLGRNEKQFRRSFDKYGEFGDQLAEIAYAKYKG